MMTGKDKCQIVAGVQMRGDARVLLWVSFLVYSLFFLVFLFFFVAVFFVLFF